MRVWKGEGNGKKKVVVGMSGGNMVKTWQISIKVIIDK